jgi:uncharacterized membrane protein
MCAECKSILYMHTGNMYVLRIVTITVQDLKIFSYFSFIMFLSERWEKVIVISRFR